MENFIKTIGEYDIFFDDETKVYKNKKKYAGWDKEYIMLNFEKIFSDKTLNKIRQIKCKETCKECFYEKPCKGYSNE